MNNLIRKSVLSIMFIGASLVLIASFSNHPIALDFLSTIAFEFGYKILSLGLFYAAARIILNKRRHELLAEIKSDRPGDQYKVMIYCVTILSIAIIIAFTG